MSNPQPAPISGNVINQIMYLETPGNNSKHVDRCCIADLGNSLNRAFFGVCFCTITGYGRKEVFFGVREKFWRTGLSMRDEAASDSSKWIGQNKLGDILMALRQKLNSPSI